MSGRTALEISSALLAMHNDALRKLGFDCAARIDEAGVLVDRQHAEIERLTADKETLVHNANRAFAAMQGQQEEIERLTEKNSMLIRNSIISYDDLERLMAERYAAIAAAVAAEREACASLAWQRICGSQGFAGPSCCILETGHSGSHIYGVPIQMSAPSIAQAIRARAKP